MTSHDKYLDELLHDAWIPLPPAEVDGSVVLQCHRDGGRRRVYFRVTLTECSIRSLDDPDQRGGMKVLSVTVNERELCFEGVEGNDLRLGLPAAIKHVSTGSVDDTRSWTAKLGFGEGEAPRPASEVVPITESAANRVEVTADEVDDEANGQRDEPSEPDQATW